MSRGDTWHSPLVSAAALPHSRPKSPPEGRGRAGSSGWRTGESDNGRPAQWHSSCGVWDWHLPLSASRPHSSALSSAPQRKKGLFLTACAPHLRAKPGSGSSAKSHSSADREQFRSVSGTLELRWSRKTSAFLLAAVWATASPALSLLEPKPEAESCSEWNGID